MYSLLCDEKNNHVVSDPLAWPMSLLMTIAGGTVQAFYRNELDIKATPEENGIDDEATLTVQLAGISFPEVSLHIALWPTCDSEFPCQVVQDLLLLNPDMTEEMAVKGAILDADGNLISWTLSFCGHLTALPECEFH